MITGAKNLATPLPPGSECRPRSSLQSAPFGQLQLPKQKFFFPENTQLIFTLACEEYINIRGRVHKFPA